MEDLVLYVEDGTYRLFHNGKHEWWLVSKDPDVLTYTPTYSSLFVLELVEARKVWNEYMKTYKQTKLTGEIFQLVYDSDAGEILILDSEEDIMEIYLIHDASSPFRLFCREHNPFYISHRMFTAIREYFEKR